MACDAASKPKAAKTGAAIVAGEAHMKRSIFVVALALALPAAGSASAETRTFEVSGFDAVVASSHVNVVLTQGPQSVRVEERRGDFSRLVLEVRDGVLHAAREDEPFRWQNLFDWGADDTDYTVYVSTPVYRSVTVTNHADATGDLRGDDLEIRVSNHADFRGDVSGRSIRLSVSNHADFRGDITGERVEVQSGNHADAAGRIEAREVVVTASNHADVRVSGVCGELSARASNHADIQAGSLRCETGLLEASNHGDVNGHITRTVDTQASNHGDITVSGGARAVRLVERNQGGVNLR
jgi:hypothetical protein